MLAAFGSPQQNDEWPRPAAALALTAGDALLNAGRVAVITGAALFCENAFARLDRGAGRPDLQRLPYFPQVGALCCDLRAAGWGLSERGLAATMGAHLGEREL